MDSEQSVNVRIERVSTLLEMEFSRAPREVRMAAGRVSHAMRFDDVPRHEDLAMLLVFFVEQRGLARDRVEARRKVARKKAPPKKKKRRVRQDRPTGDKSVGGSSASTTSRPPDETAFSRRLDETEEDESTRRLRQKMGLSPGRVRSGDKGRTIIIGD